MSDAEKRGTVYVVDDDEAVRDSVSLLLETAGQTISSFESATAFLEAFDPKMHGCLVLDIRMPGLSGIELQAKLIEMGVYMPIIFITGHGDIPMAVEAMRKGAVNFIRKPFGENELLEGVHEALNLDMDQQANRANLDEAQMLIEKLTPREFEVFGRVASGQANKVVAIELGISERTVEIHRGQVMHKTHSRSLADLVRLNLCMEQNGLMHSV